MALRGKNQSEGGAIEASNNQRQVVPFGVFKDNEAKTLYSYQFQTKFRSVEICRISISFPGPFLSQNRPGETRSFKTPRRKSR